jgi:hypothetical protein
MQKTLAYNKVSSFPVNYESIMFIVLSPGLSSVTHFMVVVS